MQLRSGAATGGTAPIRTPPMSPPATSGDDIPEQIQITSQPRQGDNAEMPAVGGLGPRTPTMTPQVYTAGTYVTNLGRTPSEAENSGHPNSFSYLNQITGQQESPVKLEMQDQQVTDPQLHLRFRTNQQIHLSRIRSKQEIH
jgi:hypothetical protein